MNITGFAARADIVGRRVQVDWEFVPEAGETVADIPPVTLRRKQRDYAFPTAAGPDPWLVYDTGQFPPAPVPNVLTVTDLDGWEHTANGERIVFEPISVAIAVGGRFVEIIRRITATVSDLNGVALRQRVRIIDSGATPGALLANEVYYYQLFSRNLPASGDAAAQWRDSAMVTDGYGQNKMLYESLPEVYRRHDVVSGPMPTGTASVPEMAPGFGQLRRFIDPFGLALDSLRGTAEGLRGLHDLARVDARFLDNMAQWIGWDLSADIEIPLQRNEIRAASRLYRLVGTLPGLRALVTQYTGWYAQAVEFSQNMALSNQPPRRNLFAMTPDAAGGGWHGVDDAAGALGFGPANQQAGGSVASAASLTGGTTEPFALRPGMSLSLGIDGAPAVPIRFGAADFLDVTQATAAEVAAAVNRVVPGASASVSGGRVVIASETIGPTSLLRIQPAAASLITLDSAPAGRIAPSADALGRIRLFYEAWETPTQAAPGIGAPTCPSAAETGNYVLRRVHTKTFVDGAWRDSQPLFTDRLVPRADPAAVVLPDGRIWAAWLENPQTGSTRPRWSLGTGRPLVPARLIGQKSEPFALIDGARLTLTGNWSGGDVYTVHQANFANLARATAAELVTAMNGQLTHVRADRGQNGSIGFSTIVGGAAARIAIDARHSTTARVLGFDRATAVGTPGSWDDGIDWSPVNDVGSIGTGRLAEFAAVNDPAGGVRLVWAAHRAGTWRIESAQWNDRIIVATANGAFLRAGTGPWAAITGLPSTDVRAIAVDASGTAWIGSAAGVSLRHPDGTIAALAPALPSPDVRAITLGPDGSAWIATAAGVAVRAAGGGVTVLGTALQLPSNDVRGLALSPDGTVWAATAAGAAKLSATAVLQVVGTAQGLPSASVQGVTVDSAGTIYLATTGGLAIFDATGTLSVITSATGLAASDARAVAVAADGTLWVATSAGVSRRAPGGGWQTIGGANGLASLDTRSVTVGSPSAAWVGTAVGIARIGSGGAVTMLDVTGGGPPNPTGRGVQAGWSSVWELSSGGGGNREPALAVDANNRIWVAWSQRLGVGDQADNRGLRYRIYDPATIGWGPETVLTNPPVLARTSDRTPGLLAVAGGMRVYFASDRNGGFGPCSVDVSLAGVVGSLVTLPDQGCSVLSPCPVAVGAATWLFYRGDANVSLAAAGTSPANAVPAASQRVPDNGAVRRFAGATTVDLGDLNRNNGRREFGDMLCYTPNRPDNAGALMDNEFYTRGTIGLYVTRANQGAALTAQDAGRLRQMLSRFLPINARALIILVETPDVELLYPNAAGPADSYADNYPFVSNYGAISDSDAVAMLGVVVLLSNRTTDVSANPADLTTLRRRTYFPPPQ